MLEFDALWALWLLPLPLLFARLPPHRQARDSLQIPFFERLVEASGEQPGRGVSVLQRRRVQAVVAAVGWCLLISAACAPQWVGEPISVQKTARDLMLALDLSGSMATRDFTATDGTRLARLEAARRVLQDFAGRRAGDRLGLIVFGDRAYLQAPFTDDHATLLTLLDDTEVAMAGQSTALGDAIGLATALFLESETDNRVLVVLTDGNDTGSRVPPRDAAVLAAGHGITLYTVAIGDPQTVGEDALDHQTLQAIAESTGGSSFMALDATALEAAYARIDRLEPAQYDQLSYRPRRSLFHYPLAAFALLYLAALPSFAYLAQRQRQRPVH